MKFKRIIATTSAILLLISGGATLGVQAVAEKDTADVVAAPLNASSVVADMSYEKYLQMSGEHPETTQEILLKGNSFTESVGENIEVHDEYEGESDVVCWNVAGASLQYTFSITQPGYYVFSLRYRPIVSKGSDIRFDLKLDGQVPFIDADNYVFPLVWKDKSAITQDSGGNDIRPSQVESPKYVEQYFVNTEDNYDDPFMFYLSSGSHTLTLTCTDGSVAVSKIMVTPPEKLKNYSQVVAEYEKNGYQNIPADADPIKVQAENAYEKSAIALYPATYSNDAGVEPSDPIKLCLNNIGGSNWCNNGQWISWSVDVPQSGLYSLRFKALQNAAVGRSSARTLYIDGEIPFEEAKNITFDYNSGWYIKVLGDDEPQLLYLTEGTHEIRLQVTLGELETILRSLEDILLELNSIYRRIIMVTGVEPDVSRDYSLQSEIPDLLDRFTKISKALKGNIDAFEQFFGSSGSEISTIKALQIQIDEFVNRPRDIASRLKAYKDNVSSLGSILYDLRQQPLALDYIQLAPPESELPKASATFWNNLLFGIKAFFLSFATDYAVFDANSEASEVINVWVASSNAATGAATGRDQADILKRLVDNSFTPQNNIGVRLSLVDTGSSLIQATLAGRGPDVALMISADTPVNLAMRGALVDLSSFEEFESIKQRFHNQALVPFQYNGGVYALPETQDYQMLFYRSDVLNELGLSVPQTWEELYMVTALLQKSNMEVGIAEATNMFETLLYQHGESLYNDNRSSTNLKSDSAIKAFKQWTELYTLYGFNRTFDFYSRFRTGEMPIAIQSVSMYSMLTVSAPELKGLWSMAPLPGIVDENGNVNHAGTVSGLCSIILKQSEHKDAAFAFLSWWTSNEIQADFGVEIESVLGPSGRYYTANLEAFKQLPWDAETANLMTGQWSQTIATPQVPGNYYVQRCLQNAFRSVVDHAKNPREQLFKYDNEINLEIERKRKEFGLD